MIDKHMVGVAAVLSDGEGNVLLQHRAKEPGAGLYVLPGGRLDEKIPVVGIRRELKEELGIDSTILCEIYFAHDEHPSGEPFLMLYFAGFIKRGTEENLEPHKCHSLVWRPVRHIVHSTDMWANDKHAIMAANSLLHLQG